MALAHHAFRHAPAHGINDSLSTFGGHHDKIRFLGGI
jgi:hypothetical protein